MSLNKQYQAVSISAAAFVAKLVALLIISTILVSCSENKLSDSENSTIQKETISGAGDENSNAPLVHQDLSPEDATESREAILNRIDHVLNSAISNRAFPAAAIAIGSSDTVAKLKGYGSTTYDSQIDISEESLFDLASLTKVIATTSAIMKLVEQESLSLDDQVAKYVPKFGQNGKGEVAIIDILTHTAGLEPYYEFYREGITEKQVVLDRICEDTLKYPTGSKYSYSDLGMIVLVGVVEAASGMGFEEYLKANFFQPLGMNNTQFRGTGPEATDPNIAPSEDDKYFRNRLVQGEVHDENAWILGGTSGHAGLFSNAKDLSSFAQMLLNEGSLNGTTYLQPETIKHFTTRVENTLGHTRAIGWDTKEQEGYTSAGSLMGPKSFGHTGFTGTSFWIDPDADVFVILLTNRVYPTRSNRKHIPIRPQIGDLAFRAMAAE